MYPAMAMGMAAGVDDSRTEIAKAESIPASDIGIIWSTRDDDKVCSKCQFLNGRWFDAKEAYALVATVHPGCRCPPTWDVGTPDEAIVGPIEGYKPGTAQDIYRDLNIEGVTKGRVAKARRLISRGRPVEYTLEG